MVDLYILRHGNTFDPGDELLRVGARTDLALSSSGRAQAQKAGSHFAVSPGKFHRILTAPLKRTRQTAQFVADALGGPAPQICDALTEIDYGPDDGAPEALVRERVGETALKIWEEKAVAPDGWHVDVRALTAAWLAIFEDAADAPAPVLAVTSNGIARFAFRAAQKIADDFPLKLSTGCYGVVRLGGGGARVVAWNERPA